MVVPRASLAVFAAGLPVLVGQALPSVARTLDLMSFHPPAGWKVEDRGDRVVMTHTGDSRYCLLVVHASQPGSGNLETDFLTEWNRAVGSTLDAREPTRPEKLELKNGIRGLTGAATFQAEGQRGIAVLMVVGAGSRVVSVQILIPDQRALQAYEGAVDSFLSGLSIARTRATPAPVSQAEGTPFSLTGEWTHSSTSLASYVDSSGHYKGDASTAYGESITFKADGTYAFRFTGMGRGKVVRESDSGIYRRSGDELHLQGKTRGLKRYKILAWEPGADGSARLKLLDVAYEPTVGNVSVYGEDWLRAPRPAREGRRP